MAGSPTTILIPDISGFTEFMTHTELSHGSFAIGMLIDTIIGVVKDEYEISEVEGDAVLMYKRCSEPSQKEIQDTCLKIFKAFHHQRMWMQQHAICPCNACVEITNLTLKFIVHHGAVGEIKAGGFTKLSGIDVIVAHRLLKNKVPSNEYLLLTEQLLRQATKPEESGMEWSISSDEYPSIGTVEYRFALLNEERKRMPTPAKPEPDYPMEATAYVELPIAADYRDAYMVLMDIPSRADWLDTLQKVEQQLPAVFVGSIHHLTFDTYQTVVSPVQMILTAEEITYAESCQIEEKGLSLVYEFIFRRRGLTTCILSCRLLNAGEAPIAVADLSALSESMQQMAENLKTHSEQLQASFFQ